MSSDEFVAVAVQITAGEDGAAEVFHIDAIRGLSRGVTEHFSSGVQTRRAVSYRARVLAALEDVEGPPSAEEVAARFRAFVAKRPVVLGGGERAIAALEGLAGPLEGATCDLDELIELMRPGRGPGESLGASWRKASHADAGAEAERVGALYLDLLAELRALDPLILHEIAQRTASTTWPLRFFFAEGVQEGMFAPSADTVAPEATVVPAAASARGRPALTSSTARRPTSSDARPPLTTEGVVAALEAATGSAEGEYESRDEQIAMAGAVATAFAEPHHLLVEAGTGTGKSLAYLFPAACHALRNDVRVIISTDTINLQEQLLGKDIPAVQRLLAVHAPGDVRGRADNLQSAALKGRRNYLCLQRLTTLRRTPILTETEARFLVRVLIWLCRGGGDRAGLRLPAEEELLWNRFSAEGTSCFAIGNSFVRNGSCQLARARKLAEAAHLVVVNHALLLSDVGSERHVLPAYDRLIIDEAHNLEDEATDRFGFHAGQGDLASLLDAVTQRGRERETGIVADVQTAVRGSQAGAEATLLAGLLRDLSERVGRARERLPETFGVLKGFVQQHGQTEIDYDQRLLVSRATRAQPEWSQVELAWENFSLALIQVEEALDRLLIAIGEREDHGVLDKESLLGSIAAQQLAVRGVREGAGAILNQHEDSRVAWLTLSRGGAVGISSAPLSVGEMLDTYLFSAKATVVLTSATLTTGGTFAYVRERLGLEDAEELALGSPFDYQRAALLLLPRDMAEPSHPEYQRQLEDAIVLLCSASHGRALILFTSHSSLRATYRAVRPRLAQAGIKVLAQGMDGSPQELLAALRSNLETAICGTASFWEGVDVVGEALSLLIIAKLPFSVPSDPVFAARAELFDDPFRDYALPQAVLRFKQGFGRLIRHRGDRGVVAVLDRRLRSKGYGKLFLQSLPPCTVSEPALAAAGDHVQTWLAGSFPGRTAIPRPAHRRI